MANKRSPGKKSSVDILGVVDPQLTQRLLILDPQEEERRGKKKLVARSECEISFDNEANLQSCIQALRESDEELRKRPDSLKRWNWEATYREGMKIIFGVAWYDMKFFEERKDAYKSASHIEYFKRFGATPDNFKITHEIIRKKR